MSELPPHTGGCLCGAIRFEARALAANPHSCSCRMCQRHTGSIATFWVEFPRDAVSWTGPGGEPATFRSSAKSSRAFCRECGSTLGAIDDAPVVALLLGVFDDLDSKQFIPTSHSYREGLPGWWNFKEQDD